ncbi:MAG: hypothetical protein Ct9H300mP8_01970 [Gammaproteobacteria bacterium]|nr:MAG: hypothetical protein Ct9H300mP8_01970 [Gammaproteobacteria bacterium]
MYLPKNPRVRGIQEIDDSFVVIELHHRSVTEMPRSCSIAIQSDLACRSDFRDLIVPAN